MRWAAFQWPGIMFVGCSPTWLKLAATVRKRTADNPDGGMSVHLLDIAIIEAEEVSGGALGSK
ncbi:hypothetical protein [Rhizobium changzhiense]|uniref:Uncharacterized protein n=1 Tax=Rhizobium changzhiense TaxID=2692317 RepID=A0ABR6A6E7_9HYPH|nr:hypothetical protein [Rhizobium changzhiense]MBA5802128.1 hypothetical protein [Rhizobium changzhiense]NKL37508.1 hypothetical protein [Rhizobium leguminosarum bv. viciae]NNU47117.1 hypothetical protein [Rhizobium changzhiense]